MLIYIQHSVQINSLTPHPQTPSILAVIHKQSLMLILFKGGVVTPSISIVKNYHAVILDQLIRLNESSVSGSSVY